MKIKHFTGFMLGCDDYPKQIGTQWLTHDCRVWVCPNLAKAKRVLRASHQKMLEPHNVWTRIYQVSANDVVFEQGNDGLLYTNTPTKIFVERIALQQQPDVINEQQLMLNARKFSKKLLQLMEYAR